MRPKAGLRLWRDDGPGRPVIAKGAAKAELTLIAAWGDPKKRAWHSPLEAMMFSIIRAVKHAWILLLLVPSLGVAQAASLSNSQEPGSVMGISVLQGWHCKPSAGRIWPRPRFTSASRARAVLPARRTNRSSWRGTGFVPDRRTRTRALSAGRRILSSSRP